MKINITILKSLAVTGLFLILLFSVIYAGGAITLKNFKILLLISTILWFAGILLPGIMKRT